MEGSKGYIKARDQKRPLPPSAYYPAAYRKPAYDIAADDNAAYRKPAYCFSRDNQPAYAYCADNKQRYDIEAHDRAAYRQFAYGNVSYRKHSRQGSHTVLSAVGS